MMNLFQVVMSSTSTQTQFRISRRSGSVLINDYLRIYEYAETKYNLCYHRRKAQAVVVTGPPGIGECPYLYRQDTRFIIIDNEGKTVWLLFALRRRCAEKKPVIWYNETFVWTLVDSQWRPTPSRPESHPSFRQLCFLSRQTALETLSHSRGGCHRGYGPMELEGSLSSVCLLLLPYSS